jgi:nucleoside-diphosphate-sugar epimerase
LDAHTEEYSKTKSVAERIWLGCNGMPNGKIQVNKLCVASDLMSWPEPWSIILAEITACLSGNPANQTLKTAAIRGSAIYGEGEGRHFPRIIRHLRNNLLSAFSFGDPARNRVDYVHVVNLNQLHLLAAIAAHGDRSTGEAFFASDDDPKSQFRLLEPFHKAYGKPLPRLNLPLELMLALAWILEWLYFLTTTSLYMMYFTRPLVPYVPLAFLTRAEVYKSGQNHWCRMDKAKRILGYTSLVKEPSVVAQIQQMPPSPPEEYSFGSMLGMHRLAVYFSKQEG